MQDATLGQSLLSSHEGYRDYRQGLISSQDDTALKERLKEMGIAGIRGEGIKCLHAHYAHYRVLGDNPVGEKVEELLCRREVGECTKICIDEKGSKETR